MNEHAENWANLHKSSLSRLSLKIQFSLFRSQSAQQCAFKGRSMQQRVGAQQHGGIGQQRHAPRQPQTIEKHLSQSELVFLVRLSGFNPRSDLLQQSLSGPRVQGQQSEQGFMSGRCVGKLSGAGAGFPANRAEWCRRHCSKPMQVVAHIVAEPLQGLPCAQAASRSLWKGATIFMSERTCVTTATCQRSRHKRFLSAAR